MKNITVSLAVAADSGLVFVKVFAHIYEVNIRNLVYEIIEIDESDHLVITSEDPEVVDDLHENYKDIETDFLNNTLEGHDIQTTPFNRISRKF